MLIQYARYQKGKRKRQPYACFVAESSSKVGWSLCHRKDMFVKKIGKEIAKNRAQQGTNFNLENIPPRLKKEFERFVMRAKRYYDREQSLD